MPTGRVKWFDSTKGFGFIKPDDGGPDVFVHFSAMKRAGLAELIEKQRIAYELAADRKTGKNAADQLKVIGPLTSATDRPRHPGNPIMAPDQALTTTKPTDSEPRLDQREATPEELGAIDQGAKDTTPANHRPEY